MNRVTGPGTPDPSKMPSTDRLKEEAQKVEKVGDVDQDQKSRKQKRNFKAMMEAQEEPSADTASTEPSPFDPAFYKSSASSKPISNLNSSAVPTPGSTQSPNLNLSPNLPSPPNPSLGLGDFSEQGSSLPQSGEFWSGVGMPDEPVKKPKILESKLKAAADQELAGKKIKGSEAERESEGAKKDRRGAPKKEFDSRAQTHTADQKEKKPVAARPNMALEKRDEEYLPAKAPKEMSFEKGKKPLEISAQPHKDEKEAQKKAKWEQKNQAAPSGRYWTPGAEEAPFSSSRIEKEETRSSLSAKDEKNRLSQQAFHSQEREAEREKLFKKREREIQKERTQVDQERKKETREKIHEQVVSASSAPLPIEARTAAQSAVTFASEYLSPEVLPLFYQMVGTITVMTELKSGITNTEVSLDSPQFAKSKFYGAKIEITKYSTAPNSLNIRLKGTDEAVAAFREHIDDLQDAFETGNFRFQIGRIEAEYSPERPLIRRKRGIHEEESGSGGQP